MVWLRDIFAAEILFAVTWAAPATTGAESGGSATALARQLEREFFEQAGCSGQSCYVADFSGSSGITPTRLPEGGKSFDYDCVVHYSSAAAWLMRYKNSFPTVEKQNTGISTTVLEGLNSLIHMTPFGRTDSGHYNASCAPNILIFAKGTLEDGPLGASVGPPLSTFLPPSWITAGVKYDANIPGTYCLGLPGGMVAKDMINEASRKCPSSNIYLSGFSQGAMVVRNGLAYADPSAKSHVRGVLTFGDPMQGAPIKGYSGPISIFCHKDDGVCSGTYELSASHSAYASDSSIMLGRNELLKWSGSSGGPGLVGKPGSSGSSVWTSNSGSSPAWPSSGNLGYSPNNLGSSSNPVWKNSGNPGSPINPTWSNSGNPNPPKNPGPVWSNSGSPNPAKNPGPVWSNNGSPNPAKNPGPVWSNNGSPNPAKNPGPVWSNSGSSNSQTNPIWSNGGSPRPPTNPVWSNGVSSNPPGNPVWSNGGSSGSPGPGWVYNSSPGSSSNSIWASDRQI